MAALQAVTTRLGTTAATLRKWARQAERDTGQRAGVTTSEQERLAVLGARIASRSKRYRSTCATSPHYSPDDAKSVPAPGICEEPRASRALRTCCRSAAPLKGFSSSAIPSWSTPVRTVVFAV